MPASSSGSRARADPGTLAGGRSSVSANSRIRIPSSARVSVRAVHAAAKASTSSRGPCAPTGSRPRRSRVSTTAAAQRGGTAETRAGCPAVRSSAPTIRPFSCIVSIAAGSKAPASTPCSTVDTLVWRTGSAASRGRASRANSATSAYETTFLSTSMSQCAVEGNPITSDPRPLAALPAPTPPVSRRQCHAAGVTPCAARMRTK